MLLIRNTEGEGNSEYSKAYDAFVSRVMATTASVLSVTYITLFSICVNIVL